MARAKKIPVASEPEAKSPERPALEPRELPVLPIRHTVLFPFGILPLNVGREKSVKLLNDVMAGDRTLAVVTQRDPTLDDPTPAE